MSRRLRKYRAALIALAVYNFVLFFPIAFMGRVISPNDIFYSSSPWATVKPPQMVQAQNPMLNDPPTSYYTLMTLVRDDWRTFNWNPYIASGIPGFGSSASAILSPFILLPALTVPLTWVYTFIVFLKLNAAFVFAWLWLREERLGRVGAAVGAIVIAGAGVYAVRWLWQITNATVLYPALFWIIRRTFNGRRNSIALVALAGLSYLLAGFPAAIAYGAWAAGLYTLFLIVRERRVPLRGFGAIAAAVIIAAMLALPSLVPFVQFLRRSGYLELRQGTSVATVFPSDHLAAFLFPDRLGHPAYKNWRGDSRLGPLNNYVETTVYLGLLTLPLALAGIFNRRARARWFWLAFAAVVFCAMYGIPPLASWMAHAPGLKFSALARLALLLPLPAGYLAAAGTRFLRKPVIGYTAAALIAFDLALLAGRFYPYLEPKTAEIPVTATMQFLREQPKPFRVAPFFDFFWPNTAELARFEDVRSHFGSEADYRRMMLRIDPTSWGGTSTVLLFNSLKFNFTEPLTHLLGIRYYVEHNVIDIVKWTIFGNTVPGVKETGSIRMKPGNVFERTVHIDAEPFWAIEIPLNAEELLAKNARIEVSLSKQGRTVWSRAFTPADARAVGKLYAPLRPYARLGESVVLRVKSVGIRGWVLQGENANAKESKLFYGRVTIPLIFERQLADGRLFRNLGELPRFRAVSSLRKMNREEFLAARDVDFERQSVITDDPVIPPDLSPANARVRLASYAPDEQHVVTDSDAPFFLASSEKLTPELAVTIDGRDVKPIQCDMLFAGVTVPAGHHEIVYTRRIARGWWWVAVVGAVLLVVAGVWDVVGRRG